MNRKNYLGYGFIALLTLTLLLTNPSKEQHVHSLERLLEMRGNRLEVFVGKIRYVVDKQEVMKYDLKVKNVLFYSVSSFSYQGENIPVGFGLLSDVYCIDYNLEDYGY